MTPARQRSAPPRLAITARPVRATLHTESRWFAERLEALLTLAVVVAAGLGLGVVCIQGSIQIADWIRAPLVVAAEGR